MQDTNTGLDNQVKLSDWWLWRITGLRIADKQHDLSNPMFQDSTLLSIPHLEELINSKVWKYEATKKEAIASIRGERELVHIDGYIAVKRAYQDSPDSLKRARESAEKRARAIVSMLTLAFVWDNSVPITCGFTHEAGRDHLLHIRMQGDESGFNFDYASTDIMSISGNAFELSRKDVLAKLADQRFAKLFEFVLSQNSEFPHGIRKTISESAIELSNSVHAFGGGGHLRAAITAIELLVGDQDVPWKTMRKRIEFLIGSETAESQFDVNAIFQARHNLIHKSEKPPRNIELKSFELAMCCLLNYVEIASKLQNNASKENIVTLLDLLRSGFSKVEFDAFSSFGLYVPIKHKPKFNGPFVKMKEG